MADEQQMDELPDKNASREDLSPTDLLELKKRLIDELKVLEVAKTAAGLDGNTGTLTELQEAVAELKDELIEESNNKSLRELFIKRYEMHTLLCDVLFKDNKDVRDTSVTKTCLDELPIASEIMMVQKDVEQLKANHDQLKFENLKLKHENMALMEKLKDHQEKDKSTFSTVSKNKEYKMLKSEFDTRCNSLEILKHIIPLLVVGAGKSDPDLQNLIMECGESFHA